MLFRSEGRGYTLGVSDWTECPIYVVEDSKFSGISVGLISYIASLNIQETKKFIKEITPHHVDSWSDTKKLLGNPLYKKTNQNLDLKRWQKEDDRQANTRAWSVRVGGAKSNMRAHLDEHLSSGIWEADRFGNADKMGHHKNRK